MAANNCLRLSQMKPGIEEIADGKYPKDVRKKVNQLVKRANIPKEIGYGDVEAPQWLVGDDKEKITLPRNGTGVDITGAIEVTVSGNLNGSPATGVALFSEEPS